MGSDSSEESDDNSESPFFCEVLDKYLVKIDPQSPPKYAYTDPAAKSYFDENGYVIFKKLASDDEVSHAITLFWDHLENESKKKVVLKYSMFKIMPVSIFFSDSARQRPHLDGSERMANLCWWSFHWTWYGNLNACLLYSNLLFLRNSSFGVYVVLPRTS